MENNELQTLVSKILQQYDIEIDDNINVGVKADDNTFEICISGTVKQDDFKRWCQDMDDDLFVEACERYEEITGEPLRELTSHEKFIDVVRQVAQEKIDLLSQYI